MPIFMDRHDVSESVTAEKVAQIHQEDLKIQHKYNCRGLTYWFDDARKTAFCLVEAPNKEAIIQMHEQAHGNVPHQIIEVDKNIVESFLGKIEEPEKTLATNFNINSESAFRAIMKVTLEYLSFEKSDLHSSISDFQQLFKNVIQSYNGNIVQQTVESFLISFRTVTEAIFCASKIHENYLNFKVTSQINFPALSIGLHAGNPVTNKKSMFEDTIELAQHMCFISCAEVVISTEVRHLFENENLGELINRPEIHTLTPVEEKFLISLMEFTEKEWQNTELKVEDFEKYIGFSKSKLYREMVRLTGKSPNIFLLYFRLRKSLQMLQKQRGNISEVAFSSGFNSPSYYAKCFRKKYGIMPSDLLPQ